MIIFKDFSFYLANEVIIDGSFFELEKLPFEEKRTVNTFWGYRLFAKQSLQNLQNLFH